MKLDIYLVSYLRSLILNKLIYRVNSKAIIAVWRSIFIVMSIPVLTPGCVETTV